MLVFTMGGAAFPFCKRHAAILNLLSYLFLRSLPRCGWVQARRCVSSATRTTRSVRVVLVGGMSVVCRWMSRLFRLPVGCSTPFWTIVHRFFSFTVIALLSLAPSLAHYRRCQDSDRRPDGMSTTLVCCLTMFDATQLPALRLDTRICGESIPFPFPSTVVVDGLPSMVRTPLVTYSPISRSYTHTSRARARSGFGCRSGTSSTRTPLPSTTTRSTTA